MEQRKPLKQMVLGKLVSHVQTNELGPLFLTTQKIIQNRLNRAEEIA